MNSSEEKQKKSMEKFHLNEKADEIIKNRNLNVLIAR